MTNQQLTQVLLVLLLLISLSQLFGWLFVKLRQPKTVGEIFAGMLVGNAGLGRLPVIAHLVADVKRQGNTLDFLYWLGLLLLMFLAGTKTQQLFSRDERKVVAWLLVVGTGLPFILGIVLAPWLLRPELFGSHGTRLSLTIVLAVGVAVTSVPVLAKIFADLNLLDTRFARLVLGVAVLEDIVLWLALAIATAAAGGASLDVLALSHQVIKIGLFFIVGLTLAPRLIKRINRLNANVFAQAAPIGYLLALLLAYCVIAGALNINIIFAAFLAGFAVVHKRRTLFVGALEDVSKVSFAFFIPIYFAIVGLKLDLIKGFSLWLVLAFVIGSSLVKFISVSVAARCAGFHGLDLLNFAITTNARGGPGIVLASVAFDTGIISAPFYTTLVLAAIVTSQIAGAWLEFSTRRHWPLLGSHSPT